MNIAEAQAMILNRVIDAALDTKDFPAEYRAALTHTRSFIVNFKRVGDLCIYMDRFRSEESSEDGIVKALHDQGLPSFEDIRQELLELAGESRHDITTTEDLVYGDVYSAYDIAILSRTYNHQTGISLIENGDVLEAVLIKVTLEGGKYPNQWLIKDKRLKYYFFSTGGKFSADYKVNRAIINSGERPIYVFLKEAPNEYRLAGIFEYVSDHNEKDGSMWFDLRVRPIEALPANDRPVVTEAAVQIELDEAVKISLESDPEARKKRLATASKIPKKIIAKTTVYSRNADVIAEATTRAKGRCESCGQPAPFNRRSDGTPYLEVHHKIRLSEGGEDTVENAVAICPNCHRKAHYGI